MEMEAGGPSSRKRKAAGLDPDEAAAAAAAEGEPAAEDQEPPPLPAAGGKDRISHLGDDVLGEIITLLPTKEGARTQALASRWRHLWRSAPLNLDHDGLCRDAKDLGAVMSRILSAHPGPGRRFCAPAYHLQGDRAADIDAWVRSPALRNLQELDLSSFERVFSFRSQPVPPVAAFCFSETLCVATIGDCRFPDITAPAIRFPRLKKLGLERVGISDSLLHAMVAGCLALECLLIEHSDGFRCVRINSVTLRSICIKDDPRFGGPQFQELVIENAPFLARLLQVGASHPRTSVISAPKLETFGFFSSGYSTRPATVIQGFHVDSLMSGVKVLAVDMRALDLDAVIGLMRCFPCVEKLYIESKGRGETNRWHHKHRDFIRSFEFCMKKISWRYYRGIKSHVEFAKFFLLNARVLELMTFQVHSKHYNEEFFGRQHKMLRLDRKASRGAQCHFTTDDSHRNGSDFRFHDLDLADPFERKDPYDFVALS